MSRPGPYHTPAFAPCTITQSPSLPSVGIGSKLMAKMGFVRGRGLGRDGSGIQRPPPVIRVPEGRSLDFIHEKSEKAVKEETKVCANSLHGPLSCVDELRVTDKLFTSQAAAKKRQRAYEVAQQRERQKTQMFDFMNTSLLTGDGRSGGVGGGSNPSSSSRAAASAFGKSRCDRCDGMHPSSSCPFYKKRRKDTPAADQSRNERVVASSQRERIAKLQKKRLVSVPLHACVKGGHG